MFLSGILKPPRQKFFEFSPPLQWRGITPINSTIRYQYGYY